MSHKSAQSAVSTIGIDLGKNSFHLVGLDQRGAIVWQLKCSRAQLERRLANIPCCLIKNAEASPNASQIVRVLLNSNANGVLTMTQPPHAMKHSDKVEQLASPERVMHEMSLLATPDHHLGNAIVLWPLG